jgi:hypothetical protein
MNCHDLRAVVTTDVKLMPGLEHLPFAEVWFRAIDEGSWREASAAARALGKSGLEVWTTDETPDVILFLERRGYEEVRRCAISELDVAAAPDPGPAGTPLVTLAERSIVLRGPAVTVESRA